MKNDFTDEESLIMSEDADFIEDDEPFESPTNSNNKKRRLEDLLEEKRLRAEMGDYDDYDSKDDDYFDQIDRTRDEDSY